MTTPEHEIEFRWKEEVYYWEGTRGCRFDGGWGVTPLVTYVPSADTWPSAAPAWAVDRRDLILRRLVEHGPSHRVEETDHYPYSIGVTREQPAAVDPAP